MRAGVLLVSLCMVWACQSAGSSCRTEINFPTMFDRPDMCFVISNCWSGTEIFKKLFLMLHTSATPKTMVLRREK